MATCSLQITLYPLLGDEWTCTGWHLGYLKLSFSEQGVLSKMEHPLLLRLRIVEGRGWPFLQYFHMPWAPIYQQFWGCSWSCSLRTIRWQQRFSYTCQRPCSLLILILVVLHQDVILVNKSRVFAHAKHASRVLWVRKCHCHVTVHPTDNPSAPKAYQCKITQSTGMAIQMQL